MSIVAKADPTTKNPQVRNVFEMVRDSSSGMAALEIALMELALMDLHRHKDAIRDGAKKSKGSTKDVGKFYRAVAKTRFSTGLPVPEEILKAKFITIPTYERKDGTVVEEHQRKLPEGAESAEDQAQLEDISRELADVREWQRSNLPSSEVEFALDYVDGLAERVQGVVDNETYRGAVGSFLRENTLGKGVVAVADYFANTGSKFQFAARAVAEFGPIAGIRLAHTYFRYGGYDVPLNQKGQGVVTEMGDKLPESGSVSKTRQWAIDTLKKRLPGAGAKDAKAEPPSEGFIIDNKGNVIAHGVGRGNDHFLPFNSKHLRKMRKAEGTEYVRRRMFGGPTVEDLHAAMMMGAQRVTVVSNGGTFTVDLSRRAHGIKMEHMQVLQRYQQILDDNAGHLNFDAYSSALSSLEAEFPLHFRLRGAESGAWAGSNDRIGPKSKFVDQIKDLFDVMGGKDERDVSTGPRQSSGTRDRIGGQRTGETARDAFLRQVRANPRARESLLNQYIQVHGENNEFVRSQRRVINTERGAQSVRTPATAGQDWSAVDIREASTPDSAQRKAKAVQPSGSQMIHNVKARNNLKTTLKDFGLDYDRPDPKEMAAVQDLAAIAADDDRWFDWLEDKDNLRHLQQMFPNIG